VKQLAHFLAEKANFNSDGTFTVYRAGITELRAIAFPALCQFSLITRLELDEGEAAGLHHLHVDVQFNGTIAGNGMEIPVAVQVVPGRPSYANAIGNYSLAVPAVGELLVVASFDEGGLPFLRLHVVHP